MQIRPLLLGHRGARSQKSVPENTLDSFDLALAHGCDGFEFDVRLSVDRHPVICHDDNIRGLEVAQTSAQRLSQLTLLDVLKRYQASAFLDIELKVSGLEIIALEALRAHPPARGFFISPRSATGTSRHRRLNSARPDLRDSSPVPAMAYGAGQIHNPAP
jgi:glycerophosphoryl diester phosphodiesterase